MFDSSGVVDALLAIFRRRERLLAIAWVIFVGAVGLSVVLDPARVRALNLAQEVVERWDNRWTVRLQAGERLVAEGRYEEAMIHLQHLDRVFPARNVRHARDRERELLLRLLGQTYEALDKRTLTIQTYKRLVEFDPNNYQNYFLLAQASDRLLSRATMAVEARDAYAAALGILPTHLPSVRGYIQYYLDRGEFIPAVEGYERYLDAFLVQNVQLRIGEGVIQFPVLVDGRSRNYEITLDPHETSGDTLAIATGGLAVSVSRVEVIPASRVGVQDPVAAFPADLLNPEQDGFEPVGERAYQPSSVGSELRFRVDHEQGPFARVLITLALFKPVDVDLWTAVSRSYENLLNETGRDLAAGRTVPLGTTEAADRVLERLPGSWRGEAARENEAQD